MWSKYCSALKKGAWTEEEDTRLKRCIEKHGEGNWHKVPLRAGLNRCRKSCRLRWFNYLHPNLKRGKFSSDEINLIIQMQKCLGNRWSLIAARLPGRTANDIKNQWTNHIYKNLKKKQQTAETTTTTQCSELQHEKSSLEFEKEHSMEWWENLLLEEEADGKAENNSSRSSGSKEHSMDWWENLLLDEEADGKPENNSSSSGSKEHSMDWWENLLLDEEAYGKEENNSSSYSGSNDDEFSFDCFPSIWT